MVGDPRWFDELCQEIVRRGPASAPDFIAVDSADGGTGATPMSLLDYVGLPIQESLPLVMVKLSEHGLRERIRVIASGKLINPGDGLGAVRGRRFCQLGARLPVRARLHSRPCSATKTPARLESPPCPRLQRGLDTADKAERVRHYVENMRHEVEISSALLRRSMTPRQLRRNCRIVVGPGRCRWTNFIAGMWSHHVSWMQLEYGQRCLANVIVDFPLPVGEQLC
ncbi:MAG: glutamate synthase-related protein [Candidatus Competibacteraceae bacterium]